VDRLEKKAVKTLREWQSTLLRIPGVTAVGRGAGSEQKIVIYVEKLTPEIEAMIPRVLDDVPVEVRESGRIRILPLLVEEALPMAVEPARTSRIRPLVGGISCGSVRIGAGTLGCMAVDSRGRVWGVSNNHVLLARRWGTNPGYPRGEVVQPGVADGGHLPEDLVGYAELGVPVYTDRLNKVDCAAFRPIVDIEPEVLDLEVRPGVREPEAGMTLWKAGRTTGCTSAKITAVDAVVDVEGWGKCRFTDCIITEPGWEFCQPGDSGSLAVDENGLPVGLVFAGSKVISCLNKASNVERMLGVTLLAWRPGVPAPVVGAEWMAYMAVGAVLCMASM